MPVVMLMLVVMLVATGAMAAVAIVVLAFRAIAARRAAQDEGPRCGNCGYNLTGAPSNRCSECGQLFIDAGVIIPKHARALRPLVTWRRAILALVAFGAVVAFLMTVLFIERHRAVAAALRVRIAAQQQQLAAAQQAAARTPGSQPGASREPPAGSTEPADDPNGAPSVP